MRIFETSALVIALGILSIVAVIDARTTDALVVTLRWVEHTHRVIEVIEDVGTSMGAARRARRAFLVTGDVETLTEYATAIAATDARLDEVRDLVRDRAPETERAGHLGVAVAARIALMDADIAARKSGLSLLTDPAAMQRSSDAAARVDSIVGAMLHDERQLLRERESASEGRVAATRNLLTVGAALGFAILIGAFLGLRHENARRRASEAELGERREALRQANAFLDSVIENLPTMLFIKEASELRFTRVNRAAERLLGVAREDLLGKNDFDLFPTEQAEFFQAKDRSALDGHAVVDVPEEPIETKDGRRWLHTMKVPIPGDGGAPGFLLGISEDITERKRAATELRRAKEAAEAASRELESFSYSVAHDLRAPLRGIDGFSLALLEDYQDQLDAEGVDYLHRVRSAAKRMAELIDDLLALSRVTRGNFARERVDVGAVARTVADQLRSADPDRDVALVIPDGLLTSADPRLVRVALENLIGNAWKFSAKKPSTLIELGAHDDAFYVRDHGAGFDMTYASKLFGVFQRLHAVSEFDGTGIGLATVQRIVHRHGGRIWAESKVGEGATFFFTLNEMESKA
jgi:PAS domain S-box-containing protein